MARMIPDVPSTSERFRRSPGEAAVYTALRTLPDPIVVIHGLHTLVRHDGQPRPDQGEADFVVLDPARGMLVVEVKGGTVLYDPDQDAWWLRMAPDHKVQISDPAERAASRCRDLRKKLKADQAWATLGLTEIPGGHAALFSNLDDIEAISRPNLTPQIRGGRGELSNLSAWIDRVFEYWGASTAPGPLWQDHAVRVLAQRFEVQPRLGVIVEHNDRQLSYWTDEQWQALQGARFMRQLGIAGGAGTGKTLLAMRRAQELAREGERTLLLCFNALLGDHLKRECQLFAQANPAAASIFAMTFHDLVTWWAIREVGPRLKRDLIAEASRDLPGQDESHVVRPQALALAFNEDTPDVQAIVVDEGQDFRDAYWGPIMQLQETRQTRLLVFYDANQRLFHRGQGFPFDLSQSYTLRKNCRNGKTIHMAAYFHYDGPEVLPNEVEGQAIERWEEPELDQAAARLRAELLRLVVKEHVPPEEIVVLLLDARKRELSEPALRQGLKDKRLRLCFGAHFESAAGCVRVETAGRFKGMEAAVVILWIQGWPDDEDERSMLYVGLSRPRSLLAVLGPQALVDRALSGTR